MERDAAARADLLRAEVVDGDGAAHVAVEGERDVVFPVFGSDGLLSVLCSGLLAFRRVVVRRVVGALAAVRSVPPGVVVVGCLVNQR